MVQMCFTYHLLDYNLYLRWCCTLVLVMSLIMIGRQDKQGGCGTNVVKGEGKQRGWCAHECSDGRTGG
jgi:hypothetical protein